MPVTKIHAFSQATMLSPYDRGTCYTQCVYVKDQDDALWKGIKTYDEAVSRAREFRQYVKISNFSRARRINSPEQLRYTALNNALTPLRVYSVELHIGQVGQAVGAANHEVCLVTNADGSAVCFFDPNLGFYIATTGGVGNNRTAFENALVGLYGANRALGSFGYQEHRRLTG
jgi:hypothetical protein